MDNEQDAGHLPNSGVTSKVLQVVGDLHAMALAPTVQGIDQAIADLQAIRGRLVATAGHPPNPG